MFPKSSSSITRPQYVCVKLNKDKKQRHINLLPLMSNPHLQSYFYSTVGSEQKESCLFEWCNYNPALKTVFVFFWKKNAFFCLCFEIPTQNADSRHLSNHIFESCLTLAVFRNSYEK